MTPGSTLVIGGTGHTGGILRRLLAAEHRVCATGFEREANERFDLAAPSDLVERVRPDIVMIPGGWTHVDRCDRRPEEAKRVRDFANACGVSWMLKPTWRRICEIVHIGTDRKNPTGMCGIRH